MKPLVVFGGTFDPFHRGHAQLAAHAARTFSARVCVLPNGKPPHRATPTTPWQHRLAMCRIGTAGMHDVTVSDYETPEKERPTATTLQHLKTQEPQAQLLLLVGADAYGSFNQWRMRQRILELAHFIVVPRAGADNTGKHPLLLNATRQLRNKKDLAHGAGGTYLWQCTAPEVSSSQCRAALAAKPPQEVAQLLQPEVTAYIRTHHLYQA